MSPAVPELPVILRKFLLEGRLRDDGYFSSINARKRLLISSLTYDLGEYLRDLLHSGEINPNLGPVPAHMAYYPPCHQREQKLGEPYAELLRLVPQIADLWRKYRTIPGLTKEGRCLVQRRYGPWAWARETMAPFSLDGRIEEPEDLIKIIDAIIGYARVWLDLLKKAEPVKDPVYKQEMLNRKKVMQKVYRDRDPGGEVIKKIFGDEKHHLFVSIIF